ncbi:MAG: hypothetical protein C0614_00195 [Desulfuromonas sp.]|nr:MAG: hypothetical protein C0614_00195 [Desulfuromonas sp.]
MSKLKKIIVGLLMALVFAAVLLPLLVKLLITPERIKQVVVPLAEQSLQRKVELGEIEVSLFSGIELHDLNVYEPDGKTLFVGSDLVRLRYQLLPLLTLKVVVDEVRLERPQIRIVRLADGGFNFSDLLEQTKDRQPPRSSTAHERREGGSAFQLLVSQVRLEEGHLLFLDHRINDLAPYRYEISNLHGAADGITLSGSIPISLSCAVNGASLALDGKVSLLQPGGTFRVLLQDLDVMAFKPYFAERIPGKLTSLQLDWESEIDVSPELLSAKGRFNGSGLGLILEAFPEAPVDGAVVSLDYDFGLDFSQDHLELRAATFNYNGLVARLAGQISALTAQTIADLQLTIPAFELRQAVAELPHSLVKGLVDFDPAGTLSATALISGELAQPVSLLKTASLMLDNVQGTAAGFRPSLTGRLDLDRDRLISRDLHLRMGDNAARITLEVSSLFDPPLSVRADLDSERFLLDPLVHGSAGAIESADVANESSTERQSAESDGIGPFDLPLQASGRLRIGETQWKGVMVRDFSAEYALKNNLLTISRMGGQVADGTFSSNSSVDLATKGLAYDTSVSFESVTVGSLLAAFFPEASGPLLGSMNAELSLKGKGSSWSIIKKNLAGYGALQFVDGRLVSPALVKGFGAFLQLPELNGISFKDFKGSLALDNGRLKIDSRLLGSRFKFYPKGSIGLDGSLNLALDTRLSPEVAAEVDRKMKVTRYLTDENGWTQLPLLVSGDLASPRFGLDPEGVQSRSVRVIGQELEKQIDKLLDKQKKTTAEGDQKPREPSAAEQLLKDSLRNLLGH